MGTNKTIMSPQANKNEKKKLIKVDPKVHQRIKVKAAQQGKKMGQLVDESTR